MMIKVDGATHARGDGAKAASLTLLVILLTLGAIAAESASPSNALAQSPSRPAAWSLVQAVDSGGPMVGDVDRSMEFFSKVLSLEKVSETEVTGAEYELMQGVFGLRMRVMRMRLGEEFIELTEYLAPRGPPIPVDSRSNDRWFQHVAIITSDIELAYQWLRKNKVEHASTGPQRLLDWSRNAGGIKAFYFKDPDGHAMQLVENVVGAEEQIVCLRLSSVTCALIWLRASAGVAAVVNRCRAGGRG